MRFIGLDLSLTATGIMAIGAGGDILETKEIGYSLKDATEREKIERHASITNEIIAFVRQHREEVLPAVAIEGYAFESKFNRETLAELHGVVRLQLYLATGIIAPRIPPSSARALIGLDIKKKSVRKKVEGEWVTEKRKDVGTAKQQVRSQLKERGILFPDDGGNMMDAYVIAMAIRAKTNGVKGG